MKKIRTALAMLLAISVLLTGMVVYAQGGSHIELYASNQNITNGTFRINRIGDTLSLQGFLYNDEELWDVDFFWTSSNSKGLNNLYVFTVMLQPEVYPCHLMKPSVFIPPHKTHNSSIFLML